MTDGKKTYAIVSGVVALLLVLALAFTVLMTSKSVANSPKPSMKQTSTHQSPTTAVKKGGTTNSVRAVVRTPDMNRVTQSVTVKR